MNRVRGLENEMGFDELAYYDDPDEYEQAQRWKRGMCLTAGSTSG
jgi:hypothetical protein